MKQKKQVKNSIKKNTKPMADIDMCPGTDCPYKETCYRYTAKPNDYQWRFSNAPIKDGKCDMYWGDNAEIIFKQLKDITKKCTE